MLTNSTFEHMVNNPSIITEYAKKGYDCGKKLIGEKSNDLYKK